MFRCLRSRVVIPVVFGMIATVPLPVLAGQDCNRSNAVYHFTPALNMQGFSAAAPTKGAMHFSLDHALMPRFAVDAQMGWREHLHLELQARDAATAYEVTSVTMRATFEYRFDDRSKLVIDIGPHPALIANERLAVEYVLRA